MANKYPIVINAAGTGFEEIQAGDTLLGLPATVADSLTAPTAPAIGDLWWDGTTMHVWANVAGTPNWVKAAPDAGAKVISSPTRPTAADNPQLGDFWWNGSILQIRATVGTSPNWVQVVPVISEPPNPAADGHHDYARRVNKAGATITHTWAEVTSIPEPSAVLDEPYSWARKATNIAGVQTREWSKDPMFNSLMLGQPGTAIGLLRIGVNNIQQASYVAPTASGGHFFYAGSSATSGKLLAGVTKDSDSIAMVYSERLRITPKGKSNTVVKLDCDPTYDHIGCVSSEPVAASELWLGQTAGIGGRVALFTSGSRRVNIEANGTVTIASGETATSFTNQALIVQKDNGKAGIAFHNAAAHKAGVIMFNEAGGGSFQCVDSSCAHHIPIEAAAFPVNSDYRLKTNIQPMTGALDRVKAIKPCTYDWKADGTAAEGFIAHELQDIVPTAVLGTKDAVDTDGNPIHQGVDYAKVVPLLTAAIQELTARLAVLEAK